MGRQLSVNLVFPELNISLNIGFPPAPICKSYKLNTESYNSYRS